MTADPARLRELAERVQRASGPDRQLDREAAAVAGWVVERRHDGAFWWVHHGLCRAREAPPEYTSSLSLDAAASMMPVGWDVVVHRRRDGTATAVAVQRGGGASLPADGRTEPNARLSAALLAMAHDAEAAR